MNDTKPFKHGEEGRGSTHSVCNKHNIGGKSLCCECSGKTDCEDMEDTRTCKNGHTMKGIGFDDICPECEEEWREEDRREEGAISNLKK